MKINKIEPIKGKHIILATYGVYAVGVNIKNLHCLIFAHPLKARIKNLQSIGRVLRKMSGKATARLIDIVDVLKHGKKNNIVMEHGVERLKIYKEESFEYKITKQKI